MKDIAQTLGNIQNLTFIVCFVLRLTKVFVKIEKGSYAKSQLNRYNIVHC